MRRSREPEREPAPQLDLRPATPLRRPRAEDEEQYVETGMAAAVLGAIGRLQLTVDLVERRLARVEEMLASQAGPAHDDAPADDAHPFDEADS